MNNNWISVKDELPNAGTYVLVITKDNYMAVAKRRDYSFLLGSYDFVTPNFDYLPEKTEIEFMEAEITHWQPLPEPPK